MDVLPRGEFEERVETGPACSSSDRVGPRSGRVAHLSHQREISMQLDEKEVSHIITIGEDDITE